MLRRQSAELLTFITFLSLAIYFSFGPYNRAMLWGWNASITKYSIKIAIALFGYWYFFWLGLAHGGSASLALAFLALGMLVSPFLVRQLEERGERSSLLSLFGVGLLLISSVILIDLDLPWRELHWASLSLFFRSWIPIICFLAAVVAEGFSDRFTYALAKELRGKAAEEKKASIEKLWRSGVVPRGKSADDVIKESATQQAIPLCLIVSLIMLILGSTLFPIAAVPIAPHQSWVWIGIWLIALGAIGSSARVLLVVPLQRDSLDMGAVPPLVAGRQALYFILAHMAVALIVWTARRCDDLECVIWNQTAHIDILPKGNFSYWAGLLIVVLIWLFSWIRFWRFGFFTRRLPNKA
jgi:hypothetical protein